MEAVLGRKVLDHLDAHPELLRMDTYGVPASGPEAPCGTVACLAGWALILSGEYELAGFEFFREVATGQQARGIEGIAFRLLRLSFEELRGTDGECDLFSGDQAEADAIERFRGLVEAAEAGQGASGGAVGQ